MPFDTAAIQKTMAKKKAPKPASGGGGNDIAIPQMQGIGGGVTAGPPQMAPQQPKVVPNMPSLQQPQQQTATPAGGNQQAGSFLQFANMPTPQTVLNAPPDGGFATRGGPDPGGGVLDRLAGAGRGTIEEVPRGDGTFTLPGRGEGSGDYDPSSTTSPGGGAAGDSNGSKFDTPSSISEQSDPYGGKLEDWMNDDYNMDFSPTEDQFRAQQQAEQQRLAQQMAAMGMSQSGAHAGMASDVASQSMRDLASARMQWDQQQIQNEMQRASLLFQDKWHDMDLAQQEKMANVLHDLRLKQMEYEDALASGKPGMAEAVLQDIKDSWNEFMSWFK